MGVTPFHKSNVLFVFYFHFYHCLFREGHQRRSVLDTHLASDHLRKNGTGVAEQKLVYFLDALCFIAKNCFDTNCRSLTLQAKPFRTALFQRHNHVRKSESRRAFPMLSTQPDHCSLVRKAWSSNTISSLLNIFMQPEES